MERWAEHNQELYSRENTVGNEALQSTVHLPIMQEHNDLPSIEELDKTTDLLAGGKLPGNDGIPPDVPKIRKKSVLLHHLHQANIRGNI